MKIVITSGYFDPIHKGHLQLLEMSKPLGDKLLVIVNNEIQAKLKKGREFMPFEERMLIVLAIKGVDEVIPSIDKGPSVCETLKSIRRMYPDDDLVFTKGGDRTRDCIIEANTCKELNIEIVDGLGPKIQSSSWLIANVVKQYESN